MMTIKEFASFCGCNAQTLRYYDKIDLLKPVKVDPWSGYRYYIKSQAIDFVKIKNLQSADFTIDEIKALLVMSDQQVDEAFDHKIAEQSQKLERIKKIKQSYLTEKSNMEKLVQSVSDYLLHAVSDSNVLREFGLSPEDGPAIAAKLKDYIEQTTQRYLPAESDLQMIVNDQIIRGTERIADTFDALKEKGYDDTVLLGDGTIREDEDFTKENSIAVWECHGWQFVHEFINSIPDMEEGYEYCFSFNLTEGKYSEGLEFPMFMIAAMLPRMNDDRLIKGCSVEHSDDGKNHFVLLRKKKKRG